MILSWTLFAISAVAGLGLGQITLDEAKDSILSKRDGDQCTSQPPGGWALPVYFIGDSSTADAQCASQWGQDYTPVSVIEVWRTGDGDHIAGLQFTFASGKNTPIYGNEDTSSYASQSFTLAPGDLIKNAILYGNGDGTYLGHIHLETEGGKTFDAGKDTDGIDPYGINVGGGLLMGALVTPKDGDVGNMAWLFMEDSIDKITITDVNFNQEIAGSSAGIDPQNIVVGRWYNDQDVEASYGLSPAYSVVKSFAYSQTVTTSFGASISIEISDEIFGIGVKETDSFTWSMSIEDSSTTATSSATSVTCMASGTLKPSSGVEIKGAYQTGKGTWTYTSKVTVYLKGGGSFSYSETGQLDNTSYNECTTTLEPYDEHDTLDNTSDLKLSNGLGLILAKGAGYQGSASSGGGSSGTAKTTGKTTAGPSGSGTQTTKSAGSTGGTGSATTGHNTVTKPTSPPASSHSTSQSSGSSSSSGKSSSSSTKPITTSKTTLKTTTSSSKSGTSSKSAEKAILPRSFNA